ncbi:unnamed protein product [Effrenium voratum]|uniref:Uncharacterized protein n=1 Tax=Effrenium voratum TaxID=2562239 RepID=A0AA36MX91_9DINO|nr:unnamed protein product [Effrenium voratum]CAJ1383834.1 unnamed protein product [Effrenium voratum]
MIEGTYVQVKGLRARAELNGRSGRLLRWIHPSERWEVQLESEDGSQVQGTLSVKKQNLHEFVPELETTYMSRLLPRKLHGAAETPCFPQEFREACERMKSWPKGLSKERALEFLLNGFMAATELRWQRTLSGQHSPQAGKTCFSGLQIGDLLPEYEKQHDFHHFRTNFSNSPPNKVSMCSNSTYVAAGFNDLRLLLDASMEEGASGVHFVGIDLNDFAVTKSLVIAEMLKDTSVPVTHILQVWYSSTWSKGTVSSFKKTIMAMQSSLSSGVRQLLEFWKGAEAPDLQSSRHQWLQYFVSEQRMWDACTIASFVRARDRWAACKYFVTGEVCDENSEQVEVGSITMWALPPHFSCSLPLHNADSIFATMNLEDYLPVPTDGADIVQLFVEDILKKLGRVRNLLVDGRLDIDIWQEEVTLDNCQVIKRISSLAPAGISWSNILDYTDLASFHAIATRCSAKDSCTTHYAYSMEWVKDVYGITLADWCRGRQALRASLLIELETGKALQAFAKETQIHSLLALPGFSCPSRMWMYVTAMHLYPSWVERFVSVSSAAPASVTLRSLGICLPCIMHRRFPTNIYLKWSYGHESSGGTQVSQAIQSFDATLSEVVRNLLPAKRCQ